MDKAEYQVRLESIKTLVKQGDTKTASQIAETIDWQRVKSAKTLCMIADVYEDCGRYLDADSILGIAYSRSAISKSVLQRLVENNLKLGNYAEAERYCEEFEEAAPGDPMKYLLRYKISKAGSAPLDEKIKALEEYVDREYIEEWAYELAELYNRNGQYLKASDTCDDIILWFGDEGEYTGKARELKESIAPLAVKEKEKLEADRIEEEKRQEEEAVKRSAEEEKKEEFRKADSDVIGDRLKNSIKAVFAGIESTEEEIAAGFEGAPEFEIPEEYLYEDIPVPEVSDDNVKDLEPEDIHFGDYYEDDHEEDIAAILNLKDEGTDDKVLAAYERLTGRETDESLGLTREFDFAEELKKYRETSGEMDETDEEVSDILLPEENVEDVSDVMMPEEDVEEELISDDEPVTAGIEEEPAEEELPEEAPTEEEPAEEKPAEEETAEEIFEEEPAEEEPVAEELPEEAPTEEEPAEEEPAEEEPSEEEPVEEGSVIEEIISEPDYLETVPVEPRPMTDEEKEFFSYFSQIPGISEQVTCAISDVHNNAGDKTSRSGNIIIVGRNGSGKTRLAKGLILSICADLGISAAKMARISAEQLNEKNPAEVIAKVAGGFLIIEDAGDLSDEVAETLLLAMEFRTDDLVVFIEDEKPDIRRLLERYPGIREKFTSTVMVPVFTNDELVGFGKTYCKENGYRMDEMAILALYTKIGDNQSATEPITVGIVKQMLDKAMQHASTGPTKFGRLFSGRAKDKEGRIILREKDFEF